MEKWIKILKVLAYLYFGIAILTFYFIPGIAFSQLVHLVIGLMLIGVAHNIRYIIYYISIFFNRR